MADFCLFCNKKIGLLGKLTSKTYAEGAICGSCIERFNDALYVYYQTTDGYTLDQLRIIHPHIPELLSHRAKLKEIDSKYNDFIVPVKNKLHESELEYSELERESTRDLQSQKLEFQKEVEKMNMEEGRDSSGKKVRYNAEEREMLREQKYYIRHGMKLEADNVDVIFAREDETYWTYIEAETENLVKFEKALSLNLESAKKEIEYLKKMIRLNDGMLICERFAYVFTFVPAEKDLFGFTGKNETQSKDLVDAVKIIRATISDVLGDQAKGFNISDLSYRQLAQTQHDYAEIMGNLDVELARATGVLESQTLAIRAQEVMEDSKSESELTLELRKEYHRFKDILNKCHEDYDDRCNRLQKMYISFLQAARSGQIQPQKNVYALETEKAALPVAQPMPPGKAEPKDSPFHKEDQPSLSVSSSYVNFSIGSILKTVVARHAFTDVGIICQSGLPIKNDKADKAKISFGIPDTDDIYFIASGQMMGGISETSKGFAITTSGIFYRKNGREQGFYDWELFSSIRISSNTFTYIEIGAVELQVSGQRKVLELLLDLQREIRNNLSDIVVIPQPSVPQKADESRAIPAQQAIPKKIETTEPVEKAPAAETTTVKESSSEIICPSCNKANKSTARFCNYCGSPLLEETRFCTQCGAKLRPGKKFCSGCGAKIE